MLDPKILNQISDQPGVYLIHNSQKEVVYIGKAKSLKKRLAQYMKPEGDGRALMPYLYKEAVYIDTIIVTSETEALILENTLIKRHQPKYNILLKDDKSYMAISLDHKLDWPRLRLIRYRQPSKSLELFGPYSALIAKELAQTVEDTFLLRRCSDRELYNRTRPCLLYGMKRCLAPCMKFCTPQDYEEQVDQVKQFLSGKLANVLSSIDAKINRACEKLDFEKADQLHQLKLRLEKVNSPQSVDTLSSENAELLHIERQADRVCLCRLSVRSGKVIALTQEIFESIEEDNESLLQSLALQKLSVTAPLESNPIDIYLDLKVSALQILKKALQLTSQSGFNLKPIYRGRAKEWQEIARRNALHNLQKSSLDRSERYRKLGLLKSVLKLENLPLWIECVDTSHTHAQEHVGSIIAFSEGQPDKSKYRRYRIADSSGDDLGAIIQILKRRFERATKEGKWPHLLVVDGGATHLKMAYEEFKKFDLVGLDLIAISKEKGRHDKGLNKEWLHTLNQPPLLLDTHNSTLHFVQQIRDEAHRFAIEYHRKRQSKVLTKSSLDDIPGIGPKKRKLLLNHFGSVAALKRSTFKDLENLSIINKRDRERLVDFLGIKSV
jgi:excinuclease ABC subunit C